MNSDNQPHSASAELSASLEPFTDPFPENALASALVVSDEVNEALSLHGITLPSLGADLASCTVTTAPRPLIELGRVNLATAHRLAAVLREAAGAGQAVPAAGTDR